MKLTLLPALTTLFATLLFQPTASADDEIIRNGTFQEGHAFPLNWSVANDNENLISPEAIAEFVEYETDSEGNRYLILKSTAGLTCVMQRDHQITLDPNSRYRISAEVNVSGNANGYLRLAVTPFEWVHYHCVIDLKDKPDMWERVEADFTPKAGETGVRIALMARDFQGTAAFRNISLVKVD